MSETITKEITEGWVVEMFDGVVTADVTETKSGFALTIQFPNRSPVERRCGSMDEANDYVTKVLLNRIATKMDEVLKPMFTTGN